MLPSYYEFLNPVKIIAGYKALDNVPHELKLLQAERPLIITDQGIVKAGLLKTVLQGFDDSDVTIGAIYEDTPVDSSVKIVNAIAKIFKQNNCDSIVAVGGGSVIDTAKGVNIVVSENTNDLMKYGGSDRLKTPQKPFLVIPTTSGTGSEVTSVAVIYDPVKKIKMPFASALLMPKVAVLDPRMTLSLPAKMTAATALDALTHAIEAYTGVQKNPMSDAYAFSSIQLISKNLYTSVQNPKDIQARFELANAATMAGAAFSNSMVGAVHAIGHACGSVAHVPHGVAMAILLPHVMRFNREKVEDAYGRLLLPLAGAEVYANTAPEKRAGKSIAHINNMLKVLHRICDFPINLQQAGVIEYQLKSIAKTAINDGSLITNPKEVEYEDILEILQTALK